MQKFNIGDKVKVIKGGQGLHPEDIGKETVIISTTPPRNVQFGYDVKVEIPNGWKTNNWHAPSPQDTWCNGEYSLVLVEKEQKVVKQKFVIGDKVKVVDNGKSYTTYTKWAEAHGLTNNAYSIELDNGEEGIVVAIGPHLMDGWRGYDLVAVEKGGKQYIIGAPGLELVEQAELKFEDIKVGMRLRWSNENDCKEARSNFYGDVVEVVEKRGMYIYVNTTKGHSGGWYANCFELVKQEKITEYEGIAVGDKVKIVSTGANFSQYHTFAREHGLNKYSGYRHLYNGDIAKVVCVGKRDKYSDDYIFGIEIKGEHYIIARSGIQKITMVNKKLTKKPKKVAYKFKAGDKVKILNNAKVKINGVNSDHYIDVGIIAEVVDKYDEGTYEVKGKSTFLKLEDARQIGVKESELELYVEAITPMDFTKPLTTAEGTPVVIVTTNGRDEKYPVLVYEGNAKILTKYTLDGKAKNKEARRNLVYVPEKKREVISYVNMYVDGISGNRYATRAEANVGACMGRIACVKIVAVEGQFDQ